MPQGVDYRPRSRSLTSRANCAILPARDASPGTRPPFFARSRPTSGCSPAHLASSRHSVCLRTPVGIVRRGGRVTSVRRLPSAPRFTSCNTFRGSLSPYQVRSMQTVVVCRPHPYVVKWWKKSSLRFVAGNREKIFSK